MPAKLALRQVKADAFAGIHIADNLRASPMFGIPRLRPIMNAILDLRKAYRLYVAVYLVRSRLQRSNQTATQEKTRRRLAGNIYARIFISPVWRISDEPLQVRFSDFERLDQSARLTCRFMRTHHLIASNRGRKAGRCCVIICVVWRNRRRSSPPTSDFG